MTTPALSLVVPHHNHTGKLPRLLDSILVQDLKNLEVILVDDASDTSCTPLVEAYRNKGLSITLLEHSERIYTMQARIRGIHAAQADIIGFADADDSLWGTEALAAHVALLHEHAADTVHFRVALTDDQGNFTENAPLTDPFAPRLRGRAILSAYLDAHEYGASSLWNKLFARHLCLKAAETAQHSRVRRYVEDIHLLLRCFFYAQNYVGSERVGYAYNYVVKDTVEAAERAVLLYTSLEEQIAWLAEQGADGETIDRVAVFMQKLICRFAGRMSLKIRRNNPRSISDASVDKLLELADAKTLIKTLLVSNGKNAEKVLAVHGLMNQS